MKKRIKKANLLEPERVFSIQTKDGTFLADGIIHHNCEICNVTLRGNLKKYKEHLIREIGEERVDALDKKKSQKISTPELEDLLKEMKAKYKNLLEEKKKALYN